VKKLAILLSILFPMLAFGSGMEIVFEKEKIKQGSLERALLRMDEATAESIELQKLKGKTLAEHFYLYSLSPLVRKRGGASYEADITLIVTKIPKSKPLLHKFPAGTANVTWSSVEILPTEAPKEFLFGVFDVPARIRILTFIGVFLLIVSSAFLGFRFYRRWQLKEEERKRKKALKDEILSANEYEDVVHLWKKKFIYLKEFPHLETPFRDLETVLFKYQFKPGQTESEKELVLSAYNKFITDIQGGFDGI
jgi:hypothetical protein